MLATKIPWFKIFKYSLYFFVLVNVVLFFQENWIASQYTNAEGIDASDLITAFADSIDTFLWLILLILFELETCVIPDHKLMGKLKHTLHGIRVVCYLFLIYAFYGYLSKLLSIYQYAPSAVANLCQLADNGFSYLLELDEYTTITASNCASLSDSNVYLKLPNANIMASAETHTNSLWLAWTDVVNAAAWLLVVLVLEIDVRLQLKGKLEGAAMLASRWIKALLYVALLAAAVYWGAAAYWGITDDFIDAWDALLWILAFAFIEQNMFDWKEEVAQTKELESSHT